jgi:hypothetical protein
MQHTWAELCTSEGFKKRNLAEETKIGLRENVVIVLVQLGPYGIELFAFVNTVLNYFFLQTLEYLDHPSYCQSFNSK